MKRLALVLVVLLLMPQPLFAQEGIGGTPGIINRNYTEQVKKLEMDKRLIQTVPEDLEEERKMMKDEEEKEPKDYQRGNVIHNPKFRLNEIEFEGNTIYSDKKLKSLTKLLGQDVYLEDVEDFAFKISRYYQKRGYVTSYAYIPPQEVEDGKVKIIILESKVGKKEARGNFWARSFFIEKIATGAKHLREGDVFNLKALQGAVKNMNAESYMQTSVAIERGKDELTKVEFNVKDRFPLLLEVGWDDFGRNDLGQQRANVFLGMYNLTGFGDKIYGGPILEENSTALLTGYQLPVSKYGTTLSFDYSFTKITPEGEEIPEGANGNSSFYTLTLRQPVIRNGTTELSAYAAFDWISAFAGAGIDSGSAGYAMRCPRVGGNLVADDKTGRWLLNTEATFGIDGLGAKTNIKTGPQLSFQKYTGSLIRVQSLPKELLGVVRVNGQYSPQSLFPAQQMYIGGPYSIWGFQPNELLGDWGIAGAAEIRIPLTIVKKNWSERARSALDKVKLVVFYNWGLVKQQIEAEQAPNDFLHSVGFGSYISLNETVNIQAGVGFPLGERFFNQTPLRMYFTINAEVDRLLKPKSH